MILINVDVPYTTVYFRCTVMVSRSSFEKLILVTRQRGVIKKKHKYSLSIKSKCSPMRISFSVFKIIGFMYTQVV